MMQYSVFSCSELNKFIGQFKCVGKKIAQKMFIFAQFLEKFAEKQNVPKFWKNLPNFQKLPNTCSRAKDNLVDWQSNYHRTNRKSRKSSALVIQ